MIIIHQGILIDSDTTLNNIGDYIPDECFRSFTRFKIGINVNNFILSETNLLTIIKNEGCLLFYIGNKLIVQKAYYSKKDLVFSGSLVDKISKYYYKFINLIIFMDNGVSLNDSVVN